MADRVDVSWKWSCKELRRAFLGIQAGIAIDGEVTLTNMIDAPIRDELLHLWGSYHLGGSH